MDSERGIALVAASMAMLLLMALGAALVLTTSSETMIASNFRTSGEAFYAAEAGLDRALSDLRSFGDWTEALNGSRRSSFVDGVPGARRLADGSSLDLSRIVNDANCQKAVACSVAEMNATTAERPWGPNNPRWTLYAYGPMANMLGEGSIDSPFYVVALVADDPSENDGDPALDGGNAGGTNPGAGVILVRAEAFGPRGAHRSVEATVARVDTDELGLRPGVRLRTWREQR